MQPDIESDDQEPLRSIARAGSFAHLVGDLDGMKNNLLFDPVKRRIKKIDNGASLGIVTGETITYKISKTRSSPKLIEQTHIDLVRSAPLEIVLKHKLKIDQKLHNHLRRLYPRLMEVGTRERVYLFSLFKTIFQRYGEVMARKKMEQFLLRLKNIIDNGYPKGLEKGKDYMPELEYDVTLYKNQQEAKRREKAA